MVQMIFVLRISQTPFQNYFLLYIIAGFAENYNYKLSAALSPRAELTLLSISAKMKAIKPHRCGIA